MAQVRLENVSLMKYREKSPYEIGKSHRKTKWLFFRIFCQIFLVHMDGLDLDVTSVKADLEPQGRHLN